MKGTNMKLVLQLRAAGIICIVSYFEINAIYHNMNIKAAVEQRQQQLLEDAN